MKILFVCHGNICRSTMAEFIFRDMVKKAGLSGKVQVASAGTSDEEEGNPVHPGTRRKLHQLGISAAGKYAVQLKRSDYEKYDLIIGMDRWNISSMNRIFGGDPEGKERKLLSFCGMERDVADPWYTGDFDAACRDILKGCEALLAYITEETPV